MGQRPSSKYANREHQPGSCGRLRRRRGGWIPSSAVHQVCRRAKVRGGRRRLVGREQEAWARMKTAPCVAGLQGGGEALSDVGDLAVVVVRGEALFLGCGW